MKEFIINDFIVVKLENYRTNIYIKGQLFYQCVRLLVNIKKNDVKGHDELSSIDEIAENFRLESSAQFKYEISPETEFWGLCSNLQAWAENNYDTNLLHMSIAFPLLERLNRIGDPIAKSVFKEEIRKRYCTGFAPIVKFLKGHGYLSYFSGKELNFIFNNPDVGKFITLDLSNSYLETIPRSIQNFKHLKKLDLSGNYLSALPDSISHLHLLRELNLKGNRFASFPTSILNLKSLEKLDISYNLLTRIPDKITELERLETINVRANRLIKISDSILKLQYVKNIDQCKILMKLEAIAKKEVIFKKKHDYVVGLDMSSCKLTEIPDIIMEIKTLEELNLSENKNIKRLPESIGNLKSLRVLELRWLSLEELPESIGNLTYLHKLDLTYNWLQYLPQSIGNLINLRELILYGNNLKALPKSVENLKNLKKLNLTKNLLEEVPKFLSNLKHLRDLTYQYNEFNKR